MCIKPDQKIIRKRDWMSQRWLIGSYHWLNTETTTCIMNMRHAQYERRTKEKHSADLILWLIPVFQIPVPQDHLKNTRKTRNGMSVNRHHWICGYMKCISHERARPSAFATPFFSTALLFSPLPLYFSFPLKCCFILYSFQLISLRSGCFHCLLQKERFVISKLKKHRKKVFKHNCNWEVYNNFFIPTEIAANSLCISPAVHTNLNLILTIY